MGKVYVKKKHVQSITFILEEFLNTHGGEPNTYLIDLQAANDLLDKLLPKAATPTPTKENQDGI